jgi:hypothetical protein
MVSAKAMPIRSGTMRRSTEGIEKCGQISGIGPTVTTGGRPSPATHSL